MLFIGRMVILRSVIKTLRSGIPIILITQMSDLLPKIKLKIPTCDSLLIKLEARKMQADQTSFEKVIHKMFKQSEPKDHN